MSIVSFIRNPLGIRKDYIETKKAKLEVKKLEEESRSIEKADLEDVKKYDPKVQKLVRKIEEFAEISKSVNTIRLLVPIAILAFIVFLLISFLRGCPSFR